MQLSADAINEMDLKSAEKALKQILKDPEIELPLLSNPHLHPKVEQLSDIIARLEDHIFHLTQIENLAKANAARWGKTIDNCS